MSEAAPQEHVYAETDGQVYLIRDGGILRFPRSDEPLPFPTRPAGSMDFGTDRVHKVKPILDRHPTEWLGRDGIFDRDDVDGLVKRAIYATTVRCVSEVVVSKGPRVLMVKARRGFSQGFWNIPGGFMDYGESPEAGVRREAEEELGVPVVLEGPLNTYLAGFPGKPSYTLGFVYTGHVESESFRLKSDEIEAFDWFTVDKGLTLTRNPFAKWGLVDFFLMSTEARRSLRVKRHGRARGKPGVRPTVFLDRDGVIDRRAVGDVRSQDGLEFMPGAVRGLRRLQDAGWRLVMATDQDPTGRKPMSDAKRRRMHDRLLTTLRDEGVQIAEIYYCPHNARSDCACRKPRPGMLLAAARDLGVNPRMAWLIGDKVSDVETARAFGCRAAWVGSRSWPSKVAEDARLAHPDVVADSLAKASDEILRLPFTEEPGRREAKV